MYGYVYITECISNCINSAMLSETTKNNRQTLQLSGVKDSMRSDYDVSFVPVCRIRAMHERL